MTSSQEKEFLSKAKKKNKIQWLKKDELEPEVFKAIQPVLVGLDIGVGIVPHNYLKPVVYVCCEPYEEYVNVLVEKISGEKNRTYAIRHKDWSNSIDGLADNSVDSVYLIDVIEHLPKDEGAELLKRTERIVRKQIVIFTPLGMVKQETLDGGKDAWGLNGAEYQEHKSGWLPEDFDDSWNIYACKDFHITNNIGKKLEKPFGAFWAIKNFNKKDELSNSSLDSLPVEIKDALINNLPYKYFELLNNIAEEQKKFKQLYSAHQQLENKYNKLQPEFQGQGNTFQRQDNTVLRRDNSIAARVAKKVKSFIKKLKKPKGKKFKPLVSIVIPVYNGSNYLREAIDSALAQTYGSIEVIVVNDGSTDNTEEIAKSYGDEIRYFSKENGGVASALNLALREMKGEYFSWLSHDDAYFPEKIEKQIKYLSGMSERDVVLYSDFKWMDEKSEVTDTTILNHRMLESKPEYSLLRSAINGITLLIPKKAFDEYGYFDEKLRCTQDYEKWHQMMKTYRFIHQPAVLAKYRVHPLQDTKRNPNVAIEGDVLWIKMIEEIPAEAKKRLEGSEFNFYREMSAFLKNTPYQKAKDFSDKKAEGVL